MSATVTEVEAPAEAPSARVSADPGPAAPAAPTGSATAADRSSGEAGKKAKSKESKGKKASSKSTKDASESSGSPSVAAHPRAARSVAQAKSWGALAGFFIAGYLSLPTDTLAETGLRALLAGSVCYVAAWAGAVFVWRRLVIIEMKGREQQLLSATQLLPSQSESPTPTVERSGVRAAPKPGKTTVDPIHPIAPGLPAIARTGRLPVERVERIARERERAAKERQERRRREENDSAQNQQESADDGRPHIDIRV